MFLVFSIKFDLKLSSSNVAYRCEIRLTESSPKVYHKCKIDGNWEKKKPKRVEGEEEGEEEDEDVDGEVQECWACGAGNEIFFLFYFERVQYEQYS